ncbi:MAG: DUF2207 domain-containing protein [Alphaproteobacteria bacterium]|nr:DUF2207 domain-containing protein [Alphaproteobacteria bacterium]
MRKLFFAICFICLSIGHVQAKLTKVLDQSQIPTTDSRPQSSPSSYAVTKEDLEDFLTERFEKALVVPKESIRTDNIDSQPSDELLRLQQNNNKTTFEKIYESALGRISDSSTTDSSSDMPQFLGKPSYNLPQEELNKPNFPSITVNLPPLGKPTLVPAEEHIPYLMTNIDILIDGSAKITETIVVVANGKKLKNGLKRLLPKKVFSRDQNNHKISYNLISVTANGEALDYRLSESLYGYILAPNKNYVLEPGVYTYNFEYIADNIVWDYGNFQELYWDVTGSLWNLVIARTGATISIPGTADPISLENFVGTPFNLDNKMVAVINPSPRVWGYAAQRPLFPGESLHLIMSLQPNTISAPSMGKRFLRFFEEHQDIYISLLTLFVVLGSFILSWKYIKTNKSKTKSSLPKTPIFARYLLFNRFDIKSFACFLLDLYRKNIIDIQQNEDTVLLIKRTDDLKSLSGAEQKAIKKLFTQDEPVLNANQQNRLKIMRAARIIEKDFRHKLFSALVILNSTYILFSAGMLIVGQFLISMFSANWLLTMQAFLLGDVVAVLGMFCFYWRTNSLILKIICKTIGICILLLSILLYMSVVSIWSGVIFIMVLSAIRYFIIVYSRRNGLLRSYIESTAQQKEHLLKNKENIILGREIANQQSMIWALDMEDDFMPSLPNEYNKLPAMKVFIEK